MCFVCDGEAVEFSHTPRAHWAADREVFRTGPTTMPLLLVWMHLQLSVAIMTSDAELIAIPCHRNSENKNALLSTGSFTALTFSAPLTSCWIGLYALAVLIIVVDFIIFFAPTELRKLKENVPCARNSENYLFLLCLLLSSALKFNSIDSNIWRETLSYYL